MSDKESKQVLSPVSMRLDESDVSRFKDLTKELQLSQGQLFALALQAYETEQLKKNFGNREKEIEAFQQVCNEMVSLYINSMQLNDTLERGLKQELDEQLAKQAKKLERLQEKLRDSESELRRYEQKASESQVRIDNCEIKLSDANKQLQQQIIMLDQKDAYISVLAEKLKNQTEELSGIRDKVEAYNGLQSIVENLRVELLDSQNEFKYLAEKHEHIMSENVNMSNQYNALRTQFDEMKFKFIENKSELKSVQEKNVVLESDKLKLAQDQQIIRVEYGEYIAELKSQNKRLEAQNLKLDTQLDELRDENSAFQLEYKEMIEVRRQNELLRAEVTQLKVESNTK